MCEPNPCSNLAYPYVASAGSLAGKFCYNNIAYAAAGTGPCDSWCALDANDIVPGWGFNCPMATCR